MEFKIGDLVQVKSSGPIMTVVETYETKCRCLWFNNNMPEEYNFQMKALKAFKEKKSVAAIL